MLLEPGPSRQRKTPPGVRVPLPIWALEAETAFLYGAWPLAFLLLTLPFSFLLSEVT